MDMKTTGFNKALLRVALSLLLIAAQACGTAQKYQNLSGEQSHESEQASLQLIAVDRIGEALGFQLLSVNGIESSVMPGAEIQIPAGNVHLELRVTWSNETVEELTIKFDAAVEVTYRLAVFELREPIKKPQANSTPSSPDSMGDAMAEGLGVGLIIALLPWIIVTSPVWYPIGMALEDERPFPDCCFVWLEEVDGKLASGEAPPSASGEAPPSDEKSLLDLSEYELTYRAKIAEEAKSGDPEDQLQQYYNLVEIDLVSAHKWLCKSADSGHPDARFRVGLLFETGSEKVPKDFRVAYVWYVLAAESGHYWGEANARRIQTEYLTAEGLAEARQKFNEWRPGECATDFGLSLNE
jgi:hypothetical protein